MPHLPSAGENLQTMPIQSPVVEIISLLLPIIIIKTYKLTEKKNQQLDKMDRFDKMKVRQFGCNLQRFSSFLSILGVVVSIIGIIGGYTTIVLGFESWGGLFYYVTGEALLFLSKLYLAMWIFLMIKTRKQDITGIERIGKLYIYVSGFLEIIGMIFYMGLFIIDITIVAHWGGGGWGWPRSDIGLKIAQTVCATVYFLFSCLKIHGIRVEKNKLLGKYLGFRLALIILYMTNLVIFSQYYDEDSRMIILSFIALFGGIPYLILDIGLIIILHSIRADREKTPGIEKPLDNI